MVTLPDIALARYRIAPHLTPTPLEAAPSLGENFYLKLENANKTHSFKIRGALNAILSLAPDALEKGVVAASSGNHAQALALAAHQVGVQAKIVMPAHTPKRKVNGALFYGAEVVLEPPNYDEAEKLARQIEQDENRTFISPYNDKKVIAGAGTAGMEIIEQCPGVERIIVCVSGGGLLAGIAIAAKSLKPDVEVIGVCAESSPAMYNIFYGTQKPQVWQTLAEALSGDIEAGSITVPLCQQYVDQVVLASEDQIAAAMRWMLFEQGWLIEGGGAVSVAAVLHRTIPPDGKKTVMVVSGGNVDAATIREIIVTDTD